MKRRDFLKILSFIPAVLAFPALTKPDDSIVFNGKSAYLKTDAFALNQPETVYILRKQVGWTSMEPVMIYNEPLTDKDRDEVASYLGQTCIFEGKKSRLIPCRALPPNAIA